MQSALKDLVLAGEHPCVLNVLAPLKLYGTWVTNMCLSNVGLSFDN